MKRMFISTLCLLACSSTFAGNDEFDLTLSAGVGPMVFDSSRKIDTTAAFHAALAFNIKKNWGLESFFTAGTPRRRDLGRDADMYLFLFGAVYHFTQHSDWQPFITFGSGFSHFRPNGVVSGVNPNGNESATAVNLNAGFGLQYFINDHFAFRFDARDIFTPDHAQNDYYFSAGMSYSFALKKFKFTEETMGGEPT